MNHNVLCDLNYLFMYMEISLLPPTKLRAHILFFQLSVYGGLNENGSHRSSHMFQFFFYFFFLLLNKGVQCRFGACPGTR